MNAEEVWAFTVEMYDGTALRRFVLNCRNVVIWM